MSFVKFPKIEQFRNVIYDVKHQFQYTGLDDDGIAIYDRTLELPKIKFTGTVKLHGTNSAIGYDPSKDELWCQKRTSKITPEKDNAGFARWVNENKEEFLKALRDLAKPFDIKSLIVYGEWAGGNIQKNVAISGLDKMFVIFAIRLVYITDDEKYKNGERYEFIDPRSLRDTDTPSGERLSKVEGKYNIKGVYDSMMFKTFEIEVDFSRPDLAQNEIVKMVQAVEDECPVGKHFGRKLGEDNTTGEGIVWTGGWDKGSDRHFIFKTKGEKHSVSKVKKIAEIDTAKIESIHEFVDYAVTGNRLNQSMREVFGDEVPTVKGTGDFLRWLINDIMAEEADVLEQNNLTPKDVNKFVSTKARVWFMKQLDAKAGI